VRNFHIVVHDRTGLFNGSAVPSHARSREPDGRQHHKDLAMQAPDLKGGLVYLPPSLVVASSGQSPIHWRRAFMPSFRHAYSRRSRKCEINALTNLFRRSIGMERESCETLSPYVYGHADQRDAAIAKSL
jgi:hypothetical protein